MTSKEKPSRRDLFERYAAIELGHTTKYIRSQRAVLTDQYYNEFIEVLYRAWVMAWVTANEFQAGEWDGKEVEEIK